MTNHIKHIGRYGCFSLDQLSKAKGGGHVRVAIVSNNTCKLWPKRLNNWRLRRRVKDTFDDAVDLPVLHVIGGVRLRLLGSPLVGIRGELS